MYENTAQNTVPLSIKVISLNVKTIKMCTIIIILAAIACCFAQQPLPAVLPQVIIEGTDHGGCSANGATKQAINATKFKIRSIISSRTQCPCGDGSGEWTRIAYFDTNQQCPLNWNLITTPVRGCGRSSTVFPSCNSAIFPVYGQSYSRVCGRVIAYQRGSPDAFSHSIRTNPGLEGAYMDGVSITHGAAGSQQHIWSFLLHSMKIIPVSIQTLCVPVPTLLPAGRTKSLHLLVTTISVILLILHSFTAFYPDGMVRGVVLLIPAVSSTTHHGSAQHCHSPPQMILNYASALVGLPLLMKMLWSV